jgi:hypothetical protein
MVEMPRKKSEASEASKATPEKSTPKKGEASQFPPLNPEAPELLPKLWELQPVSRGVRYLDETQTDHSRDAGQQEGC